MIFFVLKFYFGKNYLSLQLMHVPYFLWFLSMWHTSSHRNTPLFPAPIHPSLQCRQAPFPDQFLAFFQRNLVFPSLVLWIYIIVWITKMMQYILKLSHKHVVLLKCQRFNPSHTTYMVPTLSMIRSQTKPRLV